MYCGFSLKLTVGKATMNIPYTIGVHQGNNLAPLLFNIFFQAALDSLEQIWGENSLPIPKFCYFPVAKSGNLRGCLHGQSIRIGKEFPFKKFLYFGLLMHVGSDGTYKDSKTEAM
eukprot:8012978-Ditylum_brightwellii.AAC.1